MGTVMVPGHIWSLEWYLGTYSRWNGTWAHMWQGTRRGALAHMVTGIVPRHILAAPGWCLGLYGYWKGALEHMGTGRDARHIWAQE